MKQLFLALCSFLVLVVVVVHSQSISLTPPNNPKFPLLGLSDALAGSYPQFTLFNLALNSSIAWGPLPGGGGGGGFTFIPLSSTSSTPSAWTRFQAVNCSGTNPCPVATGLNSPLSSQQVALQLVPNLGCLQWFNVWGGSVHPLIQILSDCNHVYEITQNEVFVFLPYAGNPNVFLIQTYLSDTTSPPYGPLCVTATSSMGPGLWLDYCSNAAFNDPGLLWSLYGLVNPPPNAGSSQYPLIPLSAAVGGNYPTFILYNLGMNASVSWNSIPQGSGSPGTFNFYPPLNLAPANIWAWNTFQAVNCPGTWCTPAATLQSPLSNQQVVLQLVTVSPSCGGVLIWNVWGGTARLGGMVSGFCLVTSGQVSGNEAFYFISLGGTSNVFLIQANQTTNGVLCVTATNVTQATPFVLQPCSIPAANQQWALYGIGCSSGSGWIGRSGGGCQTCAPGSYSANNICVACPAGTYSNTTGSTSCTVCATGTTSVNGISCVFCPVGSTSINGICSVCPAGTYEANRICQTCGAGAISSQSNQTGCTVCLANFYSNAANTACLACPNGAVSPGATDQNGCCAPGTSISKCAAGAATTLASGWSLFQKLECYGALQEGATAPSSCSTSLFGVIGGFASFLAGAATSILNCENICDVLS